MVIDAIDGEFTVFIEDMEKAGYERAIQGFQLANVSDAYQIFLETCLSILKENLSSGKWSNRQLIEEIKSFVKVCFMGYASVAGSFLRTREEIINEKVSFLQKLLDFTRQMITAVDAESVINFASKNISTFFEAEVFLSINRNGKMIHFQNSETAKPNESVARLIKQSFKNTTTVFSDLNGNLSTDIDVSDLKRIIAIPIGAHGRVHGVLALTNYEKGVQFSHKELEMLLQFNYIV
ncbi:MAG: hypothetical protein KJO61_08955, partial [Deltaproteobacteria bacterium]|nr:hypothetical protein [Deltaproteobacteria bacterium]